MAAAVNTRTRSAIALSKADARRIAVAAQGLSQAARFVDGLAVLSHLGAIQLDAIQRVDKAHRLTCFARLREHVGRAAVDDWFWGSGPARAFESSAHAVCLLPVADWPLWGFRRRRTLDVSWRPPLTITKRILDKVDSAGPLTLRQIEGEDRSAGWDWSATKQAAEFLVWTGQLVCCERRGNQRLYDLPQRRLPPSVLSAVPSYDESVRQLAERAARALGVATRADLAEYFRTSPKDVARGIELAGLAQVEVEGWDDPAWAWPAALDTSASGAPPTLVGPFDNLIWDRDRTRRLFDFDVVFEAYKPPGKRKFGYYVLPLLVGDRLVGRVDLARRGGTLKVLATHPDTPAFAEHLHTALARLAAQLGCEL